TRIIGEQPAICTRSTPDNDIAFHVTTGLDLVDAVPGDGVCSTTADPRDPATQCSLRAAIMETNRRPGLDRILLPPRIYDLSLSGAGRESEGTPNDAVGGTASTA